MTLTLKAVYASSTLMSFTIYSHLGYTRRVQVVVPFEEGSFVLKEMVL